MEYRKHRSKYSVGHILEDGRSILEVQRMSETEYKFLLYCDNCKTKKWVKRQSGLKRKCSGCFGKIWKYDTEEDRKSNKAFTNYRYRAKKSGRVFSLTRERFLEIICQPCHWCGYAGTVGVDRIDNDLGYTPDNSVACCKTCNYAKNDMSLREWHDWISRLISHRLKENTLEVI